jgi:hypothetical protein
MHDYRVYCLDRRGKINSADWIQAERLEQAIEMVRVQFRGRRCEVWDGAECLAKVPEEQAPQTAGR